MDALKILIVRDTLMASTSGRDGYTLGRIYVDEALYGFTVEDEDRRLEAGGTKVYGKTAMPLGTYPLSLYPSPKHGLVPLFHGVPGFSYTEIHRANRVTDIKGCVGVGALRTEDGVKNCAPVLDRIIRAMREAADHGRPVFCTIERKG